MRGMSSRRLGTCTGWILPQLMLLLGIANAAATTSNQGAEPDCVAVAAGPGAQAGQETAGPSAYVALSECDRRVARRVFMAKTACAGGAELWTVERISAARLSASRWGQVLHDMYQAGVMNLEQVLNVWRSEKETADAAIPPTPTEENR